MSLPPNPTLNISRLFRNGQTDLAEWLPEGSVYWFGMGRQALFAALQALQVPKGSRVLMPAYQCPSALDPFLAYGVEPVFYDLNPRLEPDLAQLETLVRRFRPELLMVIHYYGFPVRKWAEIIELASQYHLTLLEDCAHALFSRHGQTPLGSWGHVSVFSLVKSLPVPAGGILVLRNGVDGNRSLDLPARRNEWLGLLKLLLYELERFSPFSVRTVFRSMPVVDRQVRQRMETPPNGLDLCVPRPIGGWTYRIAERCDPSAIVQRRRENYLAALSVLATTDESLLQPLFPTLPDGVCPLGCPVQISSKRDEVLTRLWRRGIPVRAIWDRLPPAIQEGEHPGTAYLRAHILVLPVHQGLHADQVERVAEITLREAKRVISRKGS